MKLIFLDIDGILNHNKFYESHSFEKLNELRDFYNDEMGESFCPISMKCLNSIIYRTGAKVVLSSSKRFIQGTLFDMNKIWSNRGFKGEIIGITPHLYFANSDETPSRGEEIKAYLNKTFGFRYFGFESTKEIECKIKESGIENYVIIDDDSDMLYPQRNNFVHIPEKSLEGLNRHYANKAIRILNSNFIDLYNFD